MKETHSIVFSVPGWLLLSACAASLACGGSGGSSGAGGSAGASAGGKTSVGSAGDNADDAGGASASGSSGNTGAGGSSDDSDSAGAGGSPAYGDESGSGGLGQGGGLGQSGGANSGGSSGHNGGANSGGSSGHNGGAGSGGSAGTAGGGPAIGKPACLAHGSQIVAVGDSYMDFMPSVTALSRAAGTLASNDAFRSFAVGGASMKSQIPAQFGRARSEDPDIVAVAINGGANDFVTLGFSPAAIKGAADAFKALLETMGGAGVRDAFYVWYPNVAWGSAGGMATAFVQLQAACQTAVSLRCHVLDLRPVFAGKEVPYEAGLFLTQAGKDAAGQALFDAMNASCVGQPATKTCCEP
jgi:hypothetical protein